MTEYGLAKIEEAKRSGLWEIDPRPDISFDMPREFSKALKQRINESIRLLEQGKKLGLK